MITVPNDQAENRHLVVAQRNGKSQLAVPRFVADAGAAAGFAWEEFFIVQTPQQP